MNDIYNGNFQSWDDVAREFGDTWDTPLNIPEPDVLYAEYDIDGYEGSAWVIYRDEDKYFLVEGGHCSCYGLEGQWNPEECTKETLIGLLDRSMEGKYPYGIGPRAAAIKERLGG